MPKEHQSRSPRSRRDEVRRILDQMGFEGLEDPALDDWDGEDLEALRDILDEESYQALLDELAEGGAHER